MTVDETTPTGLTVAYLRVSIAGQSNGLESQLAAIKKALGREPDRVYSDEWSGRSMDRPGLARMLDSLRAGDSLVRDPDGEPHRAVARPERAARASLTRLISERPHQLGGGVPHCARKSGGERAHGW